ncbi:DUF3553 domain-containing protein [Alphaproteobacteria bacterium]|nr:DUF3553 domain-containing protein [Alphaproteobacteria bacterium]
MYKKFNSELIPGSYVVNKKHKDWGVGQIQTSIKNIITVNFENVGKKVININKINLEVIKL